MEKNTLKKVIIPIAGFGTRMLPATKNISKEILPLNGIPIIQYIVNEALDSGFSEIIFITNKKKSLTVDYFEKDLILESFLRKISKKNLLKKMQAISNIKVKLTTVRQKKIGLGAAILSAKSLISNQPFAVMLPDMIIDSNNKKNNLALMKKNFERTGKSSLLLGKAKKSDIHKYGIAKFKKNSNKNNFFPIDDIVEKPSPKKAPSNLFAVGRYIFDNKILDFLSNEKPDSSGEIQLTGSISKYLKSSNKINGLIVQGDVHDCGNKLGFLIANLAFSFKDSKLRREVLKFINKSFVK